MAIAKVYSTEGKVIKVIDANSLKELQEAVGGYVDYLDLIEGFGAYCNDNGLLEELPTNIFILENFGIIIAGNIVLVNSNTNSSGKHYDLDFISKEYN